ncbi:MAG: hybrid sensor histidine kinase/response regulator [Simkaniaceae bacterium]|nr:hybrid sensor histidine kinase/response regulator [Simkaniaceae bacterium]
MEQREILIVEDSSTQALLLKKNLEEKGILVTHVTNGVEALEAISKKQPTFVISDVTMPEMDGFELCQKIRENPETKQLPVVLYTALYETPEVLKAISSGANCFLTKPCDTDFLLQFAEDQLIQRDRESNFQPCRFVYRGEEHNYTVDINTVMSLLVSTYANAVKKNKSLEETQHELKGKNVQLKMMNELKNSFLGMAAHDLRNPLGVIQAYSSLLNDSLKGKIEDNLFEMIETIHASTGKILQIVNEFLDVSVIESGNLSINLEETDLKSIFEKNIKLNNNLAVKKEMELRLEIEGEIPNVSCDGKKIEQVLTNFVTNAIKYSHPKSTITVKMQKIDDFLQFSVQDQGQGIPKEEQDKLFKNFSTTSVKSTGGEASTGLGLAIVKKIIDAHHGEIGFESEEGKGSTFFVKLPLNQPKEEAA